MADQSENKRDFFRASTELNATLRSKGKKHHVKIVDISAGGVKVESDEVFFVDENVTIDFTLLDNQFSKTCKIVHVMVGEGVHNTYGCMFEYIKDADQKKINSFVFAAQAGGR